GLSAISVFGETVGVRLLISSALGSVIVIGVLVAVLFIRLATNLAIPGWATYTVGLLIVALLNLITVAIVVTLVILASRNNISFLYAAASQWTCLEPDGRLAEDLRRTAQSRGFDRCTVVAGKIQDLGSFPRFDTILYIDVLEHIPDDTNELAEAAARLKPNGT